VATITRFTVTKLIVRVDLRSRARGRSEDPRGQRGSDDGTRHVVEVPVDSHIPSATAILTVDATRAGTKATPAMAVSTTTTPRLNQVATTRSVSGSSHVRSRAYMAYGW